MWLAGGFTPVAGRSMGGLARFGGVSHPLWMVACIGFFAALAKLVGGALAASAEARLGGDVGENLRLEVLGRVLRLDVCETPRQLDHGSVPAHGAYATDVASLTSHVDDVERGVSEGVFAEIRAVVELVPLLVLLGLLAPRLAVSAVVAFIAFGCLVLVTRRALRRRHADAARERESILGAADEAVRHAELWKTYGAENRIALHVRRLGAQFVDTSARLRVRAALLSGTSEVLGALALVLALALATLGVIDVGRATLVPFAIVFFMTYKPLRQFIDARLFRARAEIALDLALGDCRPSVVPERAAPSIRWPLASLSVVGLRSRYGKHAPVSFVAEKGAIVAVVGPTGAGKTALLRVLLGLDAPVEGRVAYDDVTLTRKGTGPTARPFAWVPQDAPLLRDTFENNVALGRGDRDEDGAGVRALVCDLGIEELARSVGDDALSVERNVSGGERQWIAMARALATDLPVLLLDEPTSALDGVAQKKMLDALVRLRGQRTIVMVTHKPEPLAIADVIVRLEPDHAENGTRRDGDGATARELAVEHVSVPGFEADREALRERVDAVAE